MYSLRVGIELGGSPGTRLFESIAAALVGLSAATGWAYAIKGRRLLRSDVSDEDAVKLRDQTLAEPLAALFTIPFAWTPILWECAWLSYPLIFFLLKKHSHRKSS